jgi:hypothetical protein
MRRKIEVQIASPPDREHLVACLVFEKHEFAELNQEAEELVVELYPKPDGTPWVFAYADLVVALAEAKRRLTGT